MNELRHNIARKMLKLKPETSLPKKLIEMLDTVDSLCQELGGELGSRQAIAIIVAQYITGK